jgi:hypothetical protein
MILSWQRCINLTELAMTLTLEQTEELNYVEADLNYIVDDGQKPVMYVDWPEEEHKAHPPKYEAHRCRIYDARPIAEQFNLRDHGFAFATIPSKVNDFYDTDEVERVYNDEVSAIIMDAIGATNVVVFDHTFRTLNNAVLETNNTREPVKAVHNDYTDRSARQRLRDIMGDEEADKLLKRRFAIVQTWRPINHPVFTEPFALADGRTIPSSGFIAMERRYSHRTAETYHISYDPKHVFYYLPEMTPEETYIFKVYDSDKNAGVPFTGHTAFDDPTSSPEAQPRESVETRALAFF